MFMIFLICFNFLLKKCFYQCWIKRTMQYLQRKISKTSLNKFFLNKNIFKCFFIMHQKSFDKNVAIKKCFLKLFLRDSLIHRCWRWNGLRVRLRYLKKRISHRKIRFYSFRSLLCLFYFFLIKFIFRVIWYFTFRLACSLY